MTELNNNGGGGAPSEADRIAKKAMKKAAKIVKRYAAKHKTAVTRAAHHLTMAKAAHSKGLECLRKAAAHLVESHKLGKAADNSSLASNISSAADHFNTSGAEMDDIEGLLGSAMSAWGHSTNVDPNTEVGGEVNIPSLDQMTEGEVPWYDSAQPYGEKLAKFAKKLEKKLTKKLAKQVATPVGMTQEQVDQVVKAAVDKAVADNRAEMLQKQVDVLMRQPAGAPKVRIFDTTQLNKGVSGEGDKLAKLMDGINPNPTDEAEFTKSAGGMIANMIKNGPKFGNATFGKPPMYDPEFKGRGGTGARN